MSGLPICTKLRRTEPEPHYSTRSGNEMYLTDELVNPDGPEAADTIDALYEALQYAEVALEGAEESYPTAGKVLPRITAALARAPVEVAKRLMQRPTRNGAEPVNLRPEMCHFSPLRGIVEAPSRSPERHPLFQRKIINEAGRADDLAEGFCLFWGRVKPIAKRPLNHGLFLSRCGGLTQ